MRIRVFGNSYSFPVMRNNECLVADIAIINYNDHLYQRVCMMTACVLINAMNHVVNGQTHDNSQ